MKINKRHIKILLALLCIICLVTGCSKKSPKVENLTGANGTGQKVETSGNSNSTGDGPSTNGDSSQVIQSSSEGSQTSQGTQPSGNTQSVQNPNTSKQTSSSKGGTSQNNGTTNNTAQPTTQGDTTSTSKEDKKDQGILFIEGSGVKSQVSYTLNELKNMTSGIVEEDYFALNNYGTKKYYHFKGISLWYLLSQKGNLKDGITKVIFTADDGYSVEYTINEVKRNDYISDENPEKKYKMIIAWEEEGKEYDVTEGTPLKLVVGQKEPGDINKPNWVQNLKNIKVE